MAQRWPSAGPRLLREREQNLPEREYSGRWLQGAALSRDICPVDQPPPVPTRRSAPQPEWDAGPVKLFFVEKSGDDPFPDNGPLPSGGLLLVAGLAGQLRVNETVSFAEKEINLLKIKAGEKVFFHAGDPVRFLLVCFPDQNIPGFEASRPTFAAHNLPIDLAQHNAIRALETCVLAADARRLFLQAKSLELLALFLEAAERSRRTRFLHCKTEYDRERLLFAREYLLQRYDLPPTLPELARIAGLNEFKLKNGFRELFGKPVFAWLTDYKMTLAHRELAQGAHTPTQLAYDLGYSSPAHFSRAFRRHFGYPPGAVRKNGPAF